MKLSVPGMSGSSCCSSSYRSTRDSVEGIRKVVKAFRNDAQNRAFAVCMCPGVGKDIKKSFRAIGTEGTDHPSP